MKLRILTLGVLATNDRITSILTFEDPISISDFDAFVCDPDAVGAYFRGVGKGGPIDYTATINHEMLRDKLNGKRQQVEELLRTKGGVVICYLRDPDITLATQVRQNGVIHESRFGKYFFLDQIEILSSYRIPFYSVKGGVGRETKPAPTATSAARHYFRTLSPNLRFHAYFQSDFKSLGTMAIPIAYDSVQHCTALQVKVGEGRVLFLPVPHDLPSERIGAALVQTVSRILQPEEDIDEPLWSTPIQVPGAEKHDAKIEELRERLKDVKSQLTQLQSSKAEISSYKRLLFGTGKGVLEPVVRSAFRLLGFDVLEPEQYNGEWDVELHDEGGRTALVEVEGAEASIGVDKYRQLLDYINDEELQGRSHKGILVGNGFRNHPPDERGGQFSEPVIRAAHRMSFCLIPTSELFKAVCAILEKPDDDLIRVEIRASIFNTVGAWGFSR
jgi:hypothetical protein